jgi:acyl-CoA thioesterase
MVALAQSYAAQKQGLEQQPDLRSVFVQYYRPIFPSRGPVTMTVSETYIGRMWSILRVEAYQGNPAKISASADAR